MHIARLSLCVMAFAFIFASPAAQANCRDVPEGACGGDDTPYWKGYRSYHDDDGYYPGHYPCRDCYPDYPVRDPCDDCTPPHHQPSHAGSPRCVQDNVSTQVDPGFSRKRERVTVAYLPVLAPNGREICHFRLGDTVWVSHSCSRGSWCEVDVNRGGRDSAIFLPR